MTTIPKPSNFLYGLRLCSARSSGWKTRSGLPRWRGNPQDRAPVHPRRGHQRQGFRPAAMLESIYRAAGVTRGIVHLAAPRFSFRERIQVNRQLISEQDVVRLTEELRKQSSEFRLKAASGPAKAGTPKPRCLRPRSSNSSQPWALKFFAEQKCDLVIWETGLGGRLDATNVVTPVGQRHHQHFSSTTRQWLGDTLEKIATGEKAGVIKTRRAGHHDGGRNRKALAVIEKRRGRKMRRSST